MTAVSTGTELVRMVETNELSPSVANAITEAFAPIYADADLTLKDAKTIEVNDVSQKEAMKQARTVRLTLQKIRLRGDAAHKTLKEDALKITKVVDLVRRTLRTEIEAEEERLLACEQFEERILAEQRARRNAEREAAIRELGGDPALYNYADMADDAYHGLLDKLVHEANERTEEARRAEAERERAEAERLAQEQRIREENERLRKEREEREAEMKAERERLEAEKRAAEDQARKEREERERVEAEQRRQREAEDAARRKAEMAPDREKIVAYMEAIRNLPLPSVKPGPAQKVVTLIAAGVDRLLDSIESELARLD